MLKEIERKKAVEMMLDEFKREKVYYKELDDVSYNKAISRYWDFTEERADSKFTRKIRTVQFYEEV